MCYVGPMSQRKTVLNLFGADHQRSPQMQAYNPWLQNEGNKAKNPSVDSLVGSITFFSTQRASFSSPTFEKSQTQTCWHLCWSSYLVK